MFTRGETKFTQNVKKKTKQRKNKTKTEDTPLQWATIFAWNTLQRTKYTECLSFMYEPNNSQRSK